MTTSRAVVGSSAITSDGSQASAERDHHPLALAARELVGVAAPERLGQPDRLQQLVDALAAPRSELASRRVQA